MSKGVKIKERQGVVRGQFTWSYPIKSMITSSPLKKVVGVVEVVEVMNLAGKRVLNKLKMKVD